MKTIETTEYEYNKNLKKITLTDNNGTITTIYNYNGTRVKSIEFGNSKRKELSYNAGNNTDLPNHINFVEIGDDGLERSFGIDTEIRIEGDLIYYKAPEIGNITPEGPKDIKTIFEIYRVNKNDQSIKGIIIRKIFNDNLPINEQYISYYDDEFKQKANIIEIANGITVVSNRFFEFDSLGRPKYSIDYRNNNSSIYKINYIYKSDNETVLEHYTSDNILIRRDTTKYNDDGKIISETIEINDEDFSE